MLIQLIGHTTYALLALSYLVRDIYWLRVLAIPASICSILFCYFHGPEPVWLIIGWNIVFLGVNLYQVASLHCLRRRLDESGKLARFVQFLGPRISQSDAAILLNLGELREYNEGEEILTEQVPTGRMFFVWTGTPDVFVRQNHVGTCRPGSFLGEISFLTKKPCTATVRVATQGDQLISWDNIKLAEATAEATDTSRNSDGTAHGTAQREIASSGKTA